MNSFEAMGFVQVFSHCVCAMGEFEPLCTQQKASVRFYTLGVVKKFPISDGNHLAGIMCTASAQDMSLCHLIVLHSHIYLCVSIRN